MQTLSAPRPSTISSDGKVTVVSSGVAGLWQASQEMVVPIAAAASTVPAALPSAPRKSRKPPSL
jgi:hypothetical protein